MTERNTTGGCQCGAVRFEIGQTMTNAHICHCRMCQKAVGNYFIPLANAAREHFSVTRGEISYFHSSDIATRGFCNQCGTPLTMENIGGDIVHVVLGSLDDPSVYPPAKQWGIESRYDWFVNLTSLPEAETDDDDNVEEGYFDKIKASNHQHPDHSTEKWPVK